MPPVARHPSEGPAAESSSLRCRQGWGCPAGALRGAARQVPLPRFGFGEDKNNSPSFTFVLGDERNAYSQIQFHVARMSVNHRRATRRSIAALRWSRARSGRRRGEEDMMPASLRRPRMERRWLWLPSGLLFSRLFISALRRPHA